MKMGGQSLQKIKRPKQLSLASFVETEFDSKIVSDGKAVSVGKAAKSRKAGHGGKTKRPSVLAPAARAFGGSLLKDKRNRTERPITTKLAMHLVLRSTQAVGAQSFLRPKNAKNVERKVRQFAARYGVRIYQYGNSGNHLHLLIRVTNRYTWKAFIRGLTSALAYTVGAYAKGRALTERRDENGKLQASKFWDFRPFTRVVEWGRQYFVSRDYVVLNELEGLGIIPHRRDYRSSGEWRNWIESHDQYLPTVEEWMLEVMQAEVPA